MRPKFDKTPDALLPAVVQDGLTGRILLAGLINKKSYKKAIKTGFLPITTDKKHKFISTGEEESETLEVQDILVCKNGEAILFKTVPTPISLDSPVYTSFGERNVRYGYLPELESFIRRKIETPVSSSRTTRLLSRGVSQIAKKLGEEAVELVIEAMDNDNELLKGEASDLLYHIMVLLAAKDVPLDEVIEVLRKRRK